MHSIEPPAIGQCWLSEAQLELGIGVVREIDDRYVVVYFPAAQVERRYALANAPLTRVLLDVGELFISTSGLEFEIEKVKSSGSCVQYCGHDRKGVYHCLDEAELSPFHAVKLPLKRLLNHQLDHPRQYYCRYLSRFYRQQLETQELLPLISCRTQLLEHQLYVAWQVAKRFAPRVLLADEVGLGKTIEAGMIMNYQLLTQRIQRVLIVVPRALTHQWIVEMLRRFNLHFSLFNAARYEAEKQANHHENPFFAAQLILCDLEFLKDNPQCLQQLASAQMDMLIVDEAHHLQWSPDTGGDEAYTAIEYLSRHIQSVILLTATPEQLGRESHFARLRLLDPDRFFDYEHFVSQEKNYQQLASLIEQIENRQHLDPENIEKTCRQLQISADLSRLLSQPEKLIDLLLDAHGTGRVFFRNTRMRIQGFPQRHLEAMALDFPVLYSSVYEHHAGAVEQIQMLLSIERLFEQIKVAEEKTKQARWLEIDPRVHWLETLLQKYHEEKLLLICHFAQTAKELYDYFLFRGMKCSLFTEQMGLIERDRAASYFADKEDGCQILFCSEIGSEGRNFQFVRHLVLFDLPFNPDLLEQRIGRLDRIGQENDILIHLPYFRHTAQELFFRWCQQGLNLFQKTSPVSEQLFLKYRQELLELSGAKSNQKLWDALIAKTRKDYKQMLMQLEQGRDKLLEYHSCRPQHAKKLLDRAQQHEQSHALRTFFPILVDVLGIHWEDDKTEQFILKTGVAQQHSFSQLDDDGIRATFSRQHALAHEDTHFITWFHPLLDEMMDVLLSSEMGNTSIVQWQTHRFEQGTLLLENIYILQIPSVQEQHLVKTVVNNNFQPVEANIALQKGLEPIDAQVARQLVSEYAQLIRQMQDKAEQYAMQQAQSQYREIIDKRIATMRDEAQRLEHLKTVNPLVREDEINFFQQRAAALSRQENQFKLHLDALRLIICVSQSDDSI